MDYPALWSHPQFPQDFLITYFEKTSMVIPPDLQLFSTPPLSHQAFEVFLNLWRDNRFSGQDLPNGLSSQQVANFFRTFYPNVTQIPSWLLSDPRIPTALLKEFVEKAPSTIDHRGICLNPNTPIELLEALYTKRPVGFGALLRNKRTPEYIFLDILQNASPDLKLILQELNQAEYLPGSTYSFLLTSQIGSMFLPNTQHTPDWFWKKFIPQKNDAWFREHPEYFIFLSKIRQNALLNTSTLLDILNITEIPFPLPLSSQELLARYPDSRVQAAIAARLDTHVPILRMLSQSPSTLVRKSVAANLSTPADCLEVLSENIDFEVVLEAVSNPNTPIDALTKALLKHDFSQFPDVFLNPNLKESILDFFAIKFAHSLDFQSSTNSHSPLYRILQNPNLSISTREKLLYSNNPLVYRFLSLTPPLAEKAYQLFCSTNSNLSEESKKALFRNPSFPTTLAKKLYPDPSPKIKFDREQNLALYWNSVFIETINTLSTPQITMLASLIDDGQAPDDAIALTFLANDAPNTPLKLLA
jgi:hypothetical protein